MDARDGIGVVVVGHGERGGSFSNAIIKGHAEAVAGALPGVPVAAGVLSGAPSLEEALHDVSNRGARTILIYPYFMAAGYFVTTKIPGRLMDVDFASRCRVLSPLGADAGLPSMIMRQAIASAESNLGQKSDACRLLLVGHGSKVSRASANATEAVAVKLREMARFGSVMTAFLEEAPEVAEVIIADERPTVVVGFFNGDGLHAGEDVPEALASAAGPVSYTGAIGALPEVGGLIANAVETAANELLNLTSRRSA